MSAAAEARAAVAASLATALGDGWTVYAQPPEGVNAPAVVLSPGEPYRASTAYRTEDLALRAVLLLQVAAIGSLDLLDEATDIVIGALLKQDAVAVRQVGSVGLVQEVGGVSLLSATIDLVVSIERKRAS